MMAISCQNNKIVLTSLVSQKVILNHLNLKVSIQGETTVQAHNVSQRVVSMPCRWLIFLRNLWLRKEKKGVDLNRAGLSG